MRSIEPSGVSEHQDIGKKGKKRKALIILIAAVAVMLFLLFLNNLDWQSLTARAISPSEKKDTSDYYFWPVNYDADIFLDQQYLDKNRYIMYWNGNEGQTITDGNYSVYGPAIVLLSEYFDAAVNGDAEKMNSLFTDDYWKDHEKYTAFTMQRIYNIEINQLSSGVITEGEYMGVNRWTFDVRYMIMKNDGTFRNDMESDSAVPQVFEILSNGDKTLINSISGYNFMVLD